jgi:hypothetical protein
MKEEFHHWSFGGARWTCGAWDGAPLQPSTRDYLHGAPSLHGTAIIGIFSDYGKQLITHDSTINPTIKETS